MMMLPLVQRCMPRTCSHYFSGGSRILELPPFTYLILRANVVPVKKFDLDNQTFKLAKEDGENIRILGH